MESVSLPHPDVWATKISSISITLRMGPHAQNHSLLYNILAPSQLSAHLAYKRVGTSYGVTHAWLVACMDCPTLE